MKDNKIIDTKKVSEYKIGGTTYYVNLVFNPDLHEHLEDVIRRLIVRDCETTRSNQT